MTAAVAAASAAAGGCPGKQQLAPDAAVASAIADMAAAVQRGDFAGAEAAGAAAPANLALPRGCLSGLRPISEGAQACVYAAQLSPARLVASLDADGSSAAAAAPEGSLAVAVKKPRIRETAGGCCLMGVERAMGMRAGFCALRRRTAVPHRPF